VSYFSSAKNDKVEVKAAASPSTAPVRKNGDDTSTIGSAMTVTGNIVCAGSLQIYGRVAGDIHAAQPAIREGAHVEGKVIALDAVIEGTFNGTIHGNTVKLQKTAVVDGEIFNKSLAIEENARFEGVSRRLERAVEAPSANAMARDVTGGAPYGTVTALTAAE
jgi:cytoskeletal protein CcmA (bactofilin family)